MLFSTKNPMLERREARSPLQLIIQYYYKIPMGHIIFLPQASLKTGRVIPICLESFRPVSAKMTYQAPFQR